uniref:Nuclease HARBI1 n=1 Tax=Brassica oleracea TaxID=3712 RepID=A0A3P6E0W2_BRAOL|nr:unnamed protein product [Brassica oleracea]
MSSSSSDEVDEALEEMVDQVVDNFIDSVIDAHPNKQKRRAYIERHREQGHNQLWNDYFQENPTYPPEMFRRRFRMNKPLFLHIVERVSNEVPYFQQRQNSCGRYGLSALQKCTAAIRMLAYGQSGDTYDEYLRLADSTSRLCLENFTNAIIQLFGDEYLRRPTTEDLQRLLDVGEGRGFPGMIGSIDCMHWEWKNCPTAWKGTLNDINVLDRSPVFTSYKVEHQKLSSRSTTTLIVWPTILLTEFIQTGQHLSNPSHFLKVLKPRNLQKSMNPPEKMSNGLLEYYNQGLQLLKTQLYYGTWKR